MANMRILALETSGTSGSVALWDATSPNPPQQWDLPSDARSARTLAPIVQLALNERSWKPTEIELVAVTSGPGSFTGLRVGVVMAKGFGFAVQCPVVGVNTLEVIAARFSVPSDKK